MRHVAIAEIAATLLIVLMTGIYAFGGLLLAAYVSVAFPPQMKHWGIPPLLLAACSFPLVFAWCRQLIHEIALAHFLPLRFARTDLTFGKIDRPTI